jgi:hypothetical protein
LFLTGNDGIARLRINFHFLLSLYVLKNLMQRRRETPLLGAGWREVLQHFADVSDFCYSFLVPFNFAFSLNFFKSIVVGYDLQPGFQNRTSNLLRNISDNLALGSKTGFKKW